LTAKNSESKNQKTHRVSPKARAQCIYENLLQKWPHAHCELVHNTPFQLLLSVLLSAQTTDKSVNAALAPLYEKQPNFSPQDLVKMGEKKFLQLIRSIGLAPTKSKNAVLMAKQLVENHNGQVPSTRAELENLAGVGRKTASVVLGELFGEPTFAVDTHVARLAVRLGFCEENLDRNKIEDVLLKAFKKEYLPKAHHLLIFQGRYCCFARKPDCKNCNISESCNFFVSKASKNCLNHPTPALKNAKGGKSV
jgi:endonuclease III